MSKKNFDILVELLNRKGIDLNSDKAIFILNEFKKVIR